MTASGETPLGIRAQRKRATRDELLQTAKELFGERGYDNVTVAEIAAGAGVSVKTLFQHFRSKEDLLLAELDQTHERLLTALRERGPDDSPVDALVAWMSSEIENSPPTGWSAGSGRSATARRSPRCGAASTSSGRPRSRACSPTRRTRRGRRPGRGCSPPSWSRSFG